MVPRFLCIGSGLSEFPIWYLFSGDAGTPLVLGRNGKGTQGTFMRQGAEKWTRMRTEDAEMFERCTAVA